MVDMAQRQVLYGACHIASSASEQEARNAGARLASFFLFSLGLQPMGYYQAHLDITLLPQWSQSQNSLPGTPQFLI